MRVLCIDDHPVLLKGLERDVRVVLPEGDVHGFETAEDAWAFAEENGCDVPLCEIKLYCGSGIRLAEKIRERFPRRT